MDASVRISDPSSSALDLAEKARQARSMAAVLRHEAAELEEAAERWEAVSPALAEVRALHGASHTPSAS